MRPLQKERPAWALTGAKERERNVITSIHLGAQKLEAFNLKLQEKLKIIEQNEIRYEEILVDDAEIVVVAFGTAARVAQTAVKRLRDEGVPVGLFRPISLWPFPEAQLTRLAADSGRDRAFLVVEMNAGQMLHDVRAAIGNQVRINFYGRMGGVVPMPEEIEEQIRMMQVHLEEPEQYLLQESGNGYPSR